MSVLSKLNKIENLKLKINKNTHKYEKKKCVKKHKPNIVKG
jgi:hypothetical protein